MTEATRYPVVKNNLAMVLSKQGDDLRVLELMKESVYAIDSSGRRLSRPDVELLSNMGGLYASLGYPELGIPLLKCNRKS